MQMKLSNSNIQQINNQRQLYQSPQQNKEQNLSRRDKQMNQQMKIDNEHCQAQDVQSQLDSFKRNMNQQKSKCNQLISSPSLDIISQNDAYISSNDTHNTKSFRELTQYQIKQFSQDLNQKHSPPRKMVINQYNTNFRTIPSPNSISNPNNYQQKQKMIESQNNLSHQNLNNPSNLQKNIQYIQQQYQLQQVHSPQKKANDIRQTASLQQQFIKRNKKSNNVSQIENQLQNSQYKPINNIPMTPQVEKIKQSNNLKIQNNSLTSVLKDFADNIGKKKNYPSLRNEKPSSTKNIGRNKQKLNQQNNNTFESYSNSKSPSTQNKQPIQGVTSQFLNRTLDKSNNLNLNQQNYQIIISSNQQINKHHTNDNNVQKIDNNILSNCMVEVSPQSIINQLQSNQNNFKKSLNNILSQSPAANIGFLSAKHRSSNSNSTNIINKTMNHDFKQIRQQKSSNLFNSQESQRSQKFQCKSMIVNEDFKPNESNKLLGQIHLNQSQPDIDTLDSEAIAHFTDMIDQQAKDIKNDQDIQPLKKLNTKQMSLKYLDNVFSNNTNLSKNYKSNGKQQTNTEYDNKKKSQSQEFKSNKQYQTHVPYLNETLQRSLGTLQKKCFDKDILDINLKCNEDFSNPPISEKQIQNVPIIVKKSEYVHQSFTESLHSSLDTRRNLQTDPSNQINLNDNSGILSSQFSPRNDYCFNHLQKRGKYYIVADSLNALNHENIKSYCSKCAIDLVEKGNIVVHHEKVTKQNVIDRFLNNLRSDVTNLLNTTLKMIDEKEITLNKYYFNQESHINNLYDEYIKILNGLRNDDIQKLLSSKQDIQEIYNERRNIIRSHVIDVENMNKDISNNVEQILTNIQLGQFKEIISQYQDKCSEFLKDCEQSNEMNLVFLKINCEQKQELVQDLKTIFSNIRDKHFKQNDEITNTQQQKQSQSTNNTQQNQNSIKYQLENNINYTNIDINNQLYNTNCIINQQNLKADSKEKQNNFQNFYIQNENTNINKNEEQNQIQKQKEIQINNENNNLLFLNEQSLPKKSKKKFDNQLYISFENKDLFIQAAAAKNSSLKKQQALEEQIKLNEQQSYIRQIQEEEYNDIYNNNVPNYHQQDQENLIQLQQQPQNLQLQSYTDKSNISPDNLPFSFQGSISMFQIQQHSKQSNQQCQNDYSCNLELNNIDQSKLQEYENGTNLLSIEECQSYPHNLQINRTQSSKGQQIISQDLINLSLKQKQNEQQNNKKQQNNSTFRNQIQNNKQFNKNSFQSLSEVRLNQIQAELNIQQQDYYHNKQNLNINNDFQYNVNQIPQKNYHSTQVNGFHGLKGSKSSENVLIFMKDKDQNVNIINSSNLENNEFMTKKGKQFSSVEKNTNNTGFNNSQSVCTFISSSEKSNFQDSQNKTDLLQSKLPVKKDVVQVNSFIENYNLLSDEQKNQISHNSFKQEPKTSNFIVLQSNNEDQNQIGVNDLSHKNNFNTYNQLSQQQKNMNEQKDNTYDQNSEGSNDKNQEALRTQTNIGNQDVYLARFNTNFENNQDSYRSEQNISFEHYEKQIYQSQNKYPNQMINKQNLIHCQKKPPLLTTPKKIAFENSPQMKIPVDQKILYTKLSQKRETTQLRERLFPEGLNSKQFSNKSYNSHRNSQQSSNTKMKDEQDLIDQSNKFIENQNEDEQSIQNKFNNANINYQVSSNYEQNQNYERKQPGFNSKNISQIQNMSDQQQLQFQYLQNNINSQNIIHNKTLVQQQQLPEQKLIRVGLQQEQHDDCNANIYQDNQSLQLSETIERNDFEQNYDCMLMKCHELLDNDNFDSLSGSIIGQGQKYNPNVNESQNKIENNEKYSNFAQPQADATFEDSFNRSLSFNQYQQTQNAQQRQIQSPFQKKDTKFGDSMSSLGQSQSEKSQFFFSPKFKDESRNAID